MPVPSPSKETVQAFQELWQQSQRQQLQEVLDRNRDIFAARDEDCRQTGLVQHDIDTSAALPICLRQHRLALAKQTAADQRSGRWKGLE